VGGVERVGFTLAPPAPSAERHQRPLRTRSRRQKRRRAAPPPRRRAPWPLLGRRRRPRRPPRRDPVRRRARRRPTPPGAGGGGERQSVVSRSGCVTMKGHHAPSTAVRARMRAKGRRPRATHRGPRQQPAAAPHAAPRPHQLPPRRAAPRALHQRSGVLAPPTARQPDDQQHLWARQPGRSSAAARAICRGPHAPVGVLRALRGTAPRQASCARPLREQ
jgi:hypothetical protein